MSLISRWDRVWPPRKDLVAVVRFESRVSRVVGIGLPDKLLVGLVDVGPPTQELVRLSEAYVLYFASVVVCFSTIFLGCMALSSVSGVELLRVAS